MLFVCTVRVHVQYPMSFEHICHMLIQTLRKWFLLLYQCTSDNINSLNAKCIYTYMLKKQELSTSPFLECSVLKCMFKHLHDYGVTYMSVLHIQSDFDQCVAPV